MDKILNEVFKHERWVKAIDSGVDKGISKTELKKMVAPEYRAQLYIEIRDGLYEISPPRQRLIPKDDGKYRTVYVNDGVDRVLLQIINTVLFDLCPEMVHSACKSYQSGMSCGRTVRELSKQVASVGVGADVIGWKSDLSKYFDMVPIELIQQTFDKVESLTGKSIIIDLLRKFYMDDRYIDLDGNCVSGYQGLKQGCAVSAFLADAALWELDEFMSTLNTQATYVRYSDDCLYVGPNAEKAYGLYELMLMAKGLRVNESKTMFIHAHEWFTFLGFSLCDDKITISKKRLRTFQQTIQRYTLNPKVRFDTAVKLVRRFLYGDSEMPYGWVRLNLTVMNCDYDILQLDKFVKDCLRAAKTQRYKVGGLGYEPKVDGVVSRGTGAHVKRNRELIPYLDKWIPLRAMQFAVNHDKDLFETLVYNMNNKGGEQT